MKKLFTCLLILITVVSLSACGAKKEEYDLNELETRSELVFSVINSISPEVAEGLINSKDAVLEKQLIEGKLPVEAEEFKLILKSWNDATEDFGAYVSKSNPRLTTEQGKAKITYDAKFKDRDADLSFTFDENEYLTDININGHYSTLEIAKKAGLNTVLGMGTVFVMLIFISIIISLFKYIPNPENKKSSKMPEKVNPHVVDNASANKEENDEELIAVISAAIASATNQSTDDFVVRNIRKR